MGALRQLETHRGRDLCAAGVLACHFLPLCQDARRALALTQEVDQDERVSTPSLRTVA